MRQSTEPRLPLPGLVLTSLVVFVLVMASTAVLYVQLRRSADEVLLARGLDRATGLALAARSMPLDDGVLTRMSAELVDRTVQHAAVLGQDGAPLGHSLLGDISPQHAKDMVNRAVAENTWQVHGESSVLHAARLELWYPLVTVNRQLEPAILLPGAPDVGPRVLLLVLDPNEQQQTVRPALVHAAIITLLLAVLLALTVRQIRQTAIQRAQDAARSSEQRFLELGRLSAVLAHEIRNPLGAIKGFAQLTSPRFAPDDPARADMEVIVSESTRLEALVENLLRYARPLALSFQDVDVRELLQQSVRLTLAGSGPSEIHLESGPPVLAAVDGDQLGRALINVLRNAVEASEGGSRVLARVLQDSNEVRMEIDDSGHGIPDELRQAVFEPYFTTKATGTGIGLAVTRRVIEAHGGRIEIGRLPHGGTRMILIVPSRRSR